MAVTDEELAVIEARAEAATQAPWESFIEERDHSSGDDFIRTGGLDDSCPDIYVTLSYRNDHPPVPARPNDLDFIAAARQDIPVLIGEIRRLRRALDSR